MRTKLKCHLEILKPEKGSVYPSEAVKCNMPAANDGGCFCSAVDLGSGLGQSPASVASRHRTEPLSSFGAALTVNTAIEVPCKAQQMTHRELRFQTPLISYQRLIPGRWDSWIFLFLPLLPCGRLFRTLLSSNPQPLVFSTLLNKIPTS